METTPQKTKKAVIDYYQYWETEAIKADLDTKRHNFSVLCCHIQGDFNIGSVIRNANAFLASEVVIYGRKRWDRRGAVGTHNYTNLKYVKKDESLDWLKDYHVVAMDNIPGAVPIDDYKWPEDKPVVMVFGEEGAGVHQNVLDLADDIVYIKQYGSTRSLNVGCASAVAMQDYCRKVVK